MNQKNIKLISIKKNVLKRQKKDFKSYHLIKIKKKLGSTFLSKFLLKLTSKLFIPSFHLQILRYETCDRSNEEITKAMPWFKTKGNFDDYINLKEFNGKINNLQIIYDLASQAFYKFKKEFSILKKANENEFYFYLIINGNVERLNLVFVKKKISIENYLSYIIKMKLLKENQIIEKCNQLNKDVININNIDINDLEKQLTKNGIAYDLEEIKNREKEELIKNGFVINSKRKIYIPSIDNYLDISNINISQSRDTYAGYELYIGYYIKNGILKKGDFIGDLSRNENNENCTYICKTDCDIVSLDKKYTQILKFKLYDYMESKIKNIFVKIKPKYYIFNDVSDDYCLNKILPLLVYKTFKKGEKIFSQFSTYEGIYLIIKGKVQITLSQTYSELSNTFFNLSYASSHFKEYIYKTLNNIDMVNEFHLDHIINNNKNKPIEVNNEENTNKNFFSSNKYNESFNVINDIQFYILSDCESLGFNELFDIKTGLYNFNAECSSDEVNLFFISKKDFNALCEKKFEILKNVIQLVEVRAKALIGQISSYKMRFKNLVINSFKNDNSKNSVSIFSYNKKEKNLKLFKNNNLLRYFKDSKFFDYTNITGNRNNKFNFKKLFESEKNSNKNEISYGRTFQGFNTNNNNNKKNIYIKIKKDKIKENAFNLNRNISNSTTNIFKNRFLDNTINISKIKSEKKNYIYDNINNIVNKNNNNKLIKRNSSLPLLYNNFYRINMNE